MKYYWLRQDIMMADKWTLGDVRHVNNWHFRAPPVNFMEPGTYTLDVRFEAAVRVAGSGSNVKKFEPDDPVRRDLAGEYRAFTRLVIDPEKIGDQHIFRVKNIRAR